MTDAVTPFLRHCLQQYCEHAADIHITHQAEETGTVVYRVRVHEEDMPRVIGKGGRTIDALRTLVRSMGAREEQRFLLFLDESGATV
ncbi:KH domain-containing protein [Candidatus Peribacteria bacterium]|nr:KH domain-containing protein [Candidatus Peribacteria bacterium]